MVTTFATLVRADPDPGDKARDTPRKGSSEKKSILSTVWCIRFAGDSGDGMQLTGTGSPTHRGHGQRHLHFPEFPAEIRAPAGTLPGVSSFQIALLRIRHHDPGRPADVLVAMNPAALKVNIADLASKTPTKRRT